MAMKGGVRSQGFTIIETLIALAVSMAIFLSAILLISGRQNKAMFTQAVEDAQSQIQRVINEVGAGYYPNNGNITCSRSGSNISFSATSTEQGTNSDCIFLGKAIVLNSDPDTTSFRVYSIAGLRGTDMDFQPNSLAAASPAPIPNAEEVIELLYGLRVVCLRYASNTCQAPISDSLLPGGSNNTGSAIFLSSLGDSSSGVLEGSQQVDSYGLQSTDITADFTSTAGSLDTVGSYAKDKIAMCFRSGTTDQSALMLIGNNGRDTTINLQIKNGNRC